MAPYYGMVVVYLLEHSLVMDLGQVILLAQAKWLDCNLWPNGSNYRVQNYHRD